MSKTLLAAALLAVIGFGACKKDDTDDTGKPSNFIEKGSLRYINKSSDLYDIYLDDARYGNLYGDDTATYPGISTGFHRVKALQIEHVSGTPTVRQQNIYVIKDSVVTFIFP